MVSCEHTTNNLVYFRLFWSISLWKPIRSDKELPLALLDPQCDQDGHQANPDCPLANQTALNMGRTNKRALRRTQMIQNLAGWWNLIHLYALFVCDFHVRFCNEQLKRLFWAVPSLPPWRSDLPCRTCGERHRLWLTVSDGHLVLGSF